LFATHLPHFAEYGPSDTVDIAYDFKLYKRHNEKVSSRSFCSNNYAAYVAEEITYDMKSYNGHSYKQENMINNMTNFGIIMEIKGINNPFQFQKDVVSKCQIDGKGIHYSPNFTRKPSLTSGGDNMNVISVGNLDFPLLDKPIFSLCSLVLGGLGLFFVFSLILIPNPSYLFCPL